MNSINSKLRALPRVDELLDGLAPEISSYGRALVTDIARESLAETRSRLLAGEDVPVGAEESLTDIRGRLKSVASPHLTRVVNATGVILHTNLGRAPLSEKAARAAYTAATSYTNLEYELEQGRRGSRYSHVESLLTRLTGAQSAMVVNNNAAAVMLILSTLAHGREVIVSRGELVEIGGAFRVPEIMEQSGAVLREVGTTNKTHRSDYIGAIGDSTGALLKVHTSNFKITGFTEEIPLSEVAAIAHEAGVPAIYDLGSGLMAPQYGPSLGGEPDVTGAVSAGADVVCFSGDKLLGGPQAGIIVGRKDLLDGMKRNPLTRALRVDKMCLAALEETLRGYLTSPAGAPVLAMLSMPQEEIRGRAGELRERLSAIPGVEAEIERDEGEVGGGSAPSVMLPTYVVTLSALGLSAAGLEQKLRGEHAIVGRVARGKVILDPRTLLEGDADIIESAMRIIAGEAQRR